MPERSESGPFGILSFFVALQGLALLFQLSLSWRGPSLGTAASTSSWEAAAGAVPEQQGGEPACCRSAPRKPSQAGGEVQRENLKLHLEVQWQNGLKSDKGLESSFQQIEIVFAILNQWLWYADGLELQSVPSYRQKGVCIQLQPCEEKDYWILLDLFCALVWVLFG